MWTLNVKIFLLIGLLSFSLNAGNIICEDAQERVQKHLKLSSSAFERKDYHSMNEENDLTIKYIERAIASCDHNKKEDEVATKFRDSLLQRKETLKKILKKP